MPIVLPVSHLSSACNFFLSALRPLGYRYLYGGGERVGLGVHHAEFFIEQSDQPRGSKPNHIRFHASSRAAVRDFYAEALYAGAKGKDRPGYRAAADGGDVFNTVVFDREGNSIEVSFTDPNAPAPEDYESDVDRSAVRAWQRDVAESSARSRVSRHASARGSQYQPAASAAVARRSSAAADNDDARSHASARHSRAVTRSQGVVSARSRSSAARTEVVTSSRAPRTNAAGEVIAMPELMRQLSGPITTMLGKTDALSGTVPKKTVAGTVLGAAAGAVFAYAMCASEDGTTRREQFRYVKWPGDGGPPQYTDGSNVGPASGGMAALPAAMQHLAIQAPPGRPPPPSAFATRASARSEAGGGSRRRSSSMSSSHSLRSSGQRHRRQQPGSSRSSVTLVPDDASATLLFTKKHVDSPAPPPTEIDLDLDAVTVAPSDSISCAGSKYARSGLRRSSRSGRSSAERLERGPVSARRASRGVY